MVKKKNNENIKMGGATHRKTKEIGPEGATTTKWHWSGRNVFALKATDRAKNNYLREELEKGGRARTDCRGHGRGLLPPCPGLRGGRCRTGGLVGGFCIRKSSG